MTLPTTIEEALPVGGVAAEAVAALTAATVIGTFVMLNTALAGPWAKRKITAAFTDRISVNQFGPLGVGIVVPDAVRLVSKELIVPEGADRPAWDLAPLVLVFSALFAFAVIPMGNGVHLADPEVGLVFVFAIASVASLGLVMAGYASNNKYAFLGGLRAVAQNLAYEIPLILIGISVVLYTGSLQMSEIVATQRETRPSTPRCTSCSSTSASSSTSFSAGPSSRQSFSVGRPDRCCRVSSGSCSRSGRCFCSHSGFARPCRGSESTNSSRSAGSDCSCSRSSTSLRRPPSWGC